MVAALVALLPVLLFLALLVLMDSFKLVRGSAVSTALAWGMGAAVVALLVTRALDARLHLSLAVLVRYVGPVIEETLKVGLVWLLLRWRRIGFPVDAGVLGFSIGAGFAVVENTVYLQLLPDASLATWIVRGLGTAILHGGTTSIAAMLAKTLSESNPSRLLRPVSLGLAAAIALHSAYNHLLLPPVASTLLLLVCLPLLMLVVFERSEAATRDWVGAGLDLDLELLQLISSDAFTYTRFGTYLQELRGRFPGPIVVDMFCLLRLELELSVQAKTLLIARKAGLDMPVHVDIRIGLDELRHLRASIGTTGMLALTPLHVSTHRDDWHRYLVDATGGVAWWRKMLGRG